MKVLVTGGAGYIGSHTCVELLNSGREVVVIDNLSNSSYKAIQRVEKITNSKISFYQGDLLDRDFIEKVFDSEKIDSIIHFAGFKAVGESTDNPFKYYHNNIISTLNITEQMMKHNIKTIVFSSSATVYGKTDNIPITEDEPKKKCTNPYGNTKSIIEDILIDMQHASQLKNVIILRYFNPIGAHYSGLIGEDPKGIPNNLMPYISQVAIGKREKLHVWGNDYDTVDGTGVRDYIHVVDLALGHIKAIEKLGDKNEVNIYNLGTGKGTSVLEMISEFEKACGKHIDYEICARRAGDIDKYYADPSKAKRELDWQAKYTVSDMCKDTWNWQINNPNGYND